MVIPAMRPNPNARDPYSVYDGVGQQDSTAIAVSVYAKRNSGAEIQISPVRDELRVPVSQIRKNVFLKRLQGARGVGVEKYQRKKPIMHRLQYVFPEKWKSAPVKNYRTFRINEDGDLLQWRKVNAEGYTSSIRIDRITNVEADCESWNLKIHYGADKPLKLQLAFNEDPRFWAAMLIELRNERQPTLI